MADVLNCEELARSLALDVMEWVVVYASPAGETEFDEWYAPHSTTGTHEYVVRVIDWHPLTDAAHAEMVWNRMKMRDFKVRTAFWDAVTNMRLEYQNQPALPVNTLWWFLIRADWKRAVCRAALEAVTGNPVVLAEG